MSKEDSVYNAKLAEQAERYDDMVKYMKDIVSVRLAFTLYRAGTNSQATIATFSASLTRTGLAPEELLGEPLLPSSKRKKPRDPSIWLYSAPTKSKLRKK